ncbi:MAG: hypothetical protein Q8J66_06045 [Methylotenera sp.]|nr:hypothetical protein [Methylotenera sp.]
MSLMTREDVLRELELLPVWQLKNPLPSIQHVSVLSPTSEASIEPALLLSPQFEPVIEPVIEPAPLDIQNVEEVAVVATPTESFRLLINDDKTAAFVLDSAIESNDAQDIETLLSNMLKAINMHCSIDIPNATIDTLNEHVVKLVIVMGESAANSLLGQLQAIDDWRGAQSSSPIFYQNLPVMITYHPAFLLNNTAYKAKAWVDLCTAKRILQNL